MEFRELFYLQKSDRKVLAFLLCLALAVLGAMFLLGNKHGRTPLNAADSSAFATEQGLNREKMQAIEAIMNWKMVRILNYFPLIQIQLIAYNLVV